MRFFEMTYCGFSKLDAKRTGGSATGCAKQTRRFGLHIVSDRERLVNDLLSHVNKEQSDAYCGGQAAPPSERGFAPEIICRKKRQLRKWGRLPIAGDPNRVRITSNWGQNALDDRLIPAMLSDDNAKMLHLATKPVRQIASLAYKNWHATISKGVYPCPKDRVSQTYKDARSDGSKVVACAVLPERTVGDSINQEIVIGWCFGRLAKPDQKDRWGTQTRDGNKGPKHRCLLFSLFVAPAYRGRLYKNEESIATRLVKEVQKVATSMAGVSGDAVEDISTRRSFAPQLQIETIDAACMQGAKHVYEKLGFRISGDNEYAIKTWPQQTPSV